MSAQIDYWNLNKFSDHVNCKCLIYMTPAKTVYTVLYSMYSTQVQWNLSLRTPKK